MLTFYVILMAGLVGFMFGLVTSDRKYERRWSHAMESQSMIFHHFKWKHTIHFGEHEFNKKPYFTEEEVLKILGEIPMTKEDQQDE